MRVSRGGHVRESEGRARREGVSEGEEGMAWLGELGRRERAKGSVCVFCRGADVGIRAVGGT